MVCLIQVFSDKEKSQAWKSSMALNMKKQFQKIIFSLNFEDSNWSSVSGDLIIFFSFNQNVKITLNTVEGPYAIV